MPALGEAFWSPLDAGLAQLDLALGPATRAAIEGHARLLLAWNSALNLTALRTLEQVARGHVLDSLTAHALCLRLLASSGVPVEEASMLDLGSGGGYPGLPLAATLGVGECALVDSVRKKADFLAAAAGVVGAALAAGGEKAPRFTVLAERAEDLSDEPDQREARHLVVARAVGSLADVAELCLPLLGVGGHFVAWKRRGGGAARSTLADERRAARRVIHAAGGGRAEIVPAPAAQALGLVGHVLVVVRKRRPTPERYPRSPAERKRAALLP